jgi:hypothetical protein
MTSYLQPRRWIQSPAGAVLLFLAWVVLAPASVRAGCSHSVISRDQARLDSTLRGATFGPLDAAVHKPSLPGSPGRCRGAWCNQSPISPAIPPGSKQIRDESCACCTVTPAPDLSAISCLPEQVSGLHLSRRDMSIFRPPRQPVRA